MNDDKDDIPRADRELEAALKSLHPAATALPLTDAFFEAGRRSAASRAKKQLLVWRSLAGALAAVVAFIAIFPSAPVIEQRTVRIAVQPAEEPAPLPIGDASRSAEPLPPESMLTLRQVGLEKGLDHLPLPQGGHLRFTQIRDSRDLTAP
jgi:hypothetical protein